MDMEEKRDIFDRLMHLTVFNIFEPFYKDKLVLITPISKKYLKMKLN